MGKGSAVTAGYWYRLAFQAGLTKECDAFLEFRGGGKTAWSGELTQSGTITINAPNLWGGEKDQGGIVGQVDIAFGEPTQLANAYMKAVFGPKVATYRGLTTLNFLGGRYGAMNPYPQKPEFKVRKIKAGWDVECWYPEKAAIGYRDPVGHLTTFIMTYGIDGVRASNDLENWRNIGPTTQGDVHGLIGLGDRFLAHSNGYASYLTNGETWVASTGELGHWFGSYVGCVFQGVVMLPNSITGYFVSHDRGATFEPRPKPTFPTFDKLACSDTLILGCRNLYETIYKANSPDGPWTMGGNYAFSNVSDMVHGPNGFVLVGTDWGEILKAVSTADGMTFVDLPLPAFPTAKEATGIAYAPDGRGVLVTETGEVAYSDALGLWALSAFSAGTRIKGVFWSKQLAAFVLYTATTIRTSPTGAEWELRHTESTATIGVLGDGASIDTRVAGSYAMNPAHMLVYIRTSSDYAREPMENINQASLVAAADQLYSEGFGLCTKYNPQEESPDEFEQRICRVIGGSFSRSPADGQFYLDLARGDYVLEDLPILTDDDVLEFKELPTILDKAANSISVRYKDQNRNEEIVTPPVRSLGMIAAFGEIHETIDMLEIPTAELATRVAQRELLARVTPLKTHDLKCTPANTWHLRTNQRVRLQMPKRGITDMVVIVGEKKEGTLRSGAISLKTSQDVYSLPDATYVDVEHGENPRPPEVPVPIELRSFFEAPYVALARTLTRADLEQVPADAGFLQAVAADPGQMRDFTLYVADASGQATPVADSDWCPTALVVEGAGFDDKHFTLASAAGLNHVQIGMAALWRNELVRVESINLTTGAVTFGRGCADTVSVEHDPGERVWFVDAFTADDPTEYADGERLAVKVVANTGSRQMDPTLVAATFLTIEGRQGRPYPPGRLRVAGDVSPAAVAGEFAVTWAPRNRVQQADQLVDQEAAGIGPEDDVRYALRFLDAADTLLVQKLDIDGGGATVVLNYTGEVTLELYAISDVGASLQKHVRVFDYTPPGGATASTIDAPTWTPVQVVIDGGEVTP